MIELFQSIYNKCKEHAKENGVSTFRVVCDYLWARIAHGFCSEDYFLNTSGIALKNFQRKQFLSHKRWLNMMPFFNDEQFIPLLLNKKETLKLFSPFLHHAWCNPAEASFDEFKDFVKKHKQILIKPISEEGGRGIRIYVPSDNLLSDYQSLKDWLLEECIVQHPLMKFNNTSVNTIRVYSVLDKQGEVHILKTILRAGIGDNIVDNFHSGGVIYPINIEGGFIEQWGVQREVKQKIFIHPGSEQMMLGYHIPHWNMLLAMVKEMAKKLPQLRYIGWDMVVTSDGIDFIEANNNADHALFARVGMDKFFYSKIMQYK